MTCSDTYKVCGTSFQPFINTCNLNIRLWENPSDCTFRAASVCTVNSLINSSQHLDSWLLQRQRSGLAFNQLDCVLWFLIYGNLPTIIQWVLSHILFHVNTNHQSSPRHVSLILWWPLLLHIVLSSTPYLYTCDVVMFSMWLTDGCVSAAPAIHTDARTGNTAGQVQSGNSPGPQPNTGPL